MQVTFNYLRSHPNSVFVFGDNLKRRGHLGGAIFRDEPNAYGFITKKAPSGDHWAFYRPGEYQSVFERELEKLTVHIKMNLSKLWLISKIGSGLANRYNIWEQIIYPGLEPLRLFPNIKFLWEDQ